MIAFSAAIICSIIVDQNQGTFPAFEIENIIIYSLFHFKGKKASKVLLGLFIWYLTAGTEQLNLRFGSSHSEELDMSI